MIYFMRQESTNYIKVGVSCDVFARLTYLQCQFRLSMMLIGVMHGDEREELAMHQSLVQYRLVPAFEPESSKYNSEWYYPYPELLDILSGKLDDDTIYRFIKASDRLKYWNQRRKRMDWLIPIKIPYYRIHR